MKQKDRVIRNLSWQRFRRDALGKKKEGDVPDFLARNRFVMQLKLAKGGHREYDLPQEA
jgi:hypothetical protein